MEKNILAKIAALITTVSLTSCSSVSLPSFTPSNQAASPVVSSGTTSNTNAWEGNSDTIWSKLQHISPSKLAEMQSSTSDPLKTAWIQLALISKRKNLDTEQLANLLIAWRNSNPSHPANQLIPSNDTLRQLQSPPPQHIALLLPQSGTYGSSGQTVREGFLNAYYGNSAKVGKQNVKFYDTSSSQNMAALYQQAISDGADFVIGPLVKENVLQLSAMSSFSAPTLALNYTDTRYGSLPNNFFEFGLLPEDETSQIADRAREAGLARAIIIAPQSAWGKRLVSAFSGNWRAQGGSIQETWYYSPQTNFNQEIARLLNVNPSADKQLSQKDNNKTVLEQQRRHDFDVIFLFSQPQDARTIVPLLRYYHATDIPIYATSAVYSGKPNPTKDVDLNNVIVCDIPWDMQRARASGDSGSSDRLYAVGQDAYLLSQSLQRLRELPNFPIYGTTGALTLSPQHQIHRRLPCVAIRNGYI